VVMREETPHVRAPLPPAVAGRRGARVRLLA
jgi:hypothetical protein